MAKSKLKSYKEAMKSVRLSVKEAIASLEGIEELTLVGSVYVPPTPADVEVARSILETVLEYTDPKEIEKNCGCGG